MPKYNDDPMDNYIKYVSQTRGNPDDFEDWVLENNIKLPLRKKKVNKDGYDDPE